MVSFGPIVTLLLSLVTAHLGASEEAAETARAVKMHSTKSKKNVSQDRSVSITQTGAIRPVFSTSPEESRSSSEGGSVEEIVLRPFFSGVSEKKESSDAVVEKTEPKPSQQESRKSVSCAIETTSPVVEELLRTESGNKDVVILRPIFTNSSEQIVQAPDFSAEESGEITESLEKKFGSVKVWKPEEPQEQFVTEVISALPVVLGGEAEESTWDSEFPELVDQSKGKDDEFLEGYLQALVDVYYHEQEVCVRVVEGTVYLYNLPANALSSSSIIRLLYDHPCVDEIIEVKENCAPCHPERLNTGVIWLPQCTVLFAPFVADPRQISYSASYRIHDQGLADKVGTISFGDLFPVIRWQNVWPWCGDMQFDIEAGAWGVFDMSLNSTPMINADYYVGLPLSYAVGCWAYRVRLWHISSHLGDEYMVLNEDVERKNVSKEGIDFYVSNQLTCAIRYYGGIGAIISQDEEFKREKFYIEYGAEVRPWGCTNCCTWLYGTPFLAMHIRHWHDSEGDWDNNRTFALGYEWSKLSGTGRKVRLFLEYHEGFSVEGQFSRLRTEYLATKFMYGF